MTGAEHYKEAEGFLADLRTAIKSKEQIDPSKVTIGLRMAQVHATLALAQATLVGMEVTDWDAPVPGIGLE
jgi:hypothetical protein